MRHTRLGILIIGVMVCFATGLAAAPGEAARTDILINEGWEFRQVAPPNSDGGVWRPAKVPGDVHLDLLRNKLIPDPFYRDNEAKLQWIEVASWEYRTTINITPETLKKRNLELVFDGLDAYAEVFLNDSQVLDGEQHVSHLARERETRTARRGEPVARGVSFAGHSCGAGGVSRSVAPEDACGREDVRSQGRI